MMLADQSFEEYRKQIEIMTQVAATGRRAPDGEVRDSRVKAVCAHADLSSKRDPEAIIEMRIMRSRKHDELA